MLTKVASYSNAELGLVARVYAEQHRLAPRYHVTLTDTEAGERLPTVRIFNDVDKARVYAATLVDVSI